VIISSNTTTSAPLQPSKVQETADKTEKQPVSTIEPDNKGDKASTDQVDKEQRARVAELAKTDRQVRAHEQAHASVGGRYTGAPSFNFERGPDGRQYATSGEVSIDTSPIPNDPQATLAKALIVQRAALAPADPSATDRRIAAAAAATATQARVELATQSSNDRSGEASNDETPDREADRLDRQFIASGAVTDPTQQGSILDLQV
jgi:hypothetical protein